MYGAETSSSNALRGMAAGAVGGTIGSGAMVAFNHLLAWAGFAEEDTGRHHSERRADAKPNDSDGTIADEPATRKAASAAAKGLTGTALTEREKDVAGSLVHYAFGAVAGALYGAIAAAAPRVTAGGGSLYGAAVFLTAGEIGVPLAGLARAPGSYPPARHAAALATHLVFGLTLEAVRRTLMRRERATPYDVTALGV